MPASGSAPKSSTRSFTAVLERTADKLQWVIARLPFSVADVWGKRGQLRVRGEINGYAFHALLFPTRRGEHFLIVNKKLQHGGKTAPGLAARFRLAPDMSPPEKVAPPRELLRELKQSRRLLKFFESLPGSWRRDIARWITQGKQAETRERRAGQMVERLFETLEAERDLPPQFALALRQNDRAAARWEQLTPSHRRRYLMAIFHYRNPESRARRIGKVVDELSGRKSQHPAGDELI